MLSLLRLQRCAWIVNHFKRTPKLSLKTLDNEWENDEMDKANADGNGRRAWYKCFEQILLLFGVNIIYDNKVHKWYISNPDILQEDNFEQYMLSTLSTRLLVEDCIALNERLRLGQYGSGHWMRPIVAAMKKNRIIIINYKKIGATIDKPYTVQPYYVREYKNCLYLIAKKMNGDYRTFEFGRIHDICLTKNSFSFVQDDELVYMYRHMYGVMKPAYGQEPERIVLRTTGDQTQRMRINPLHSTQRETKHTNEFSEFELLIDPTNDFLAEVFSQIERMELMQPLWLRNRLEKKYRLGTSLYQADVKPGTAPLRQG